MSRTDPYQAPGCNEGVLAQGDQGESQGGCVFGGGGRTQGRSNTGDRHADMPTGVGLCR